jgi:nitroimidazol reductase NimA-like FMN-containing flavoprotein (pyridoxamine 5'-phosphate oxidase superfamily)
MIHPRAPASSPPVDGRSRQESRNLCNNGTPDASRFHGAKVGHKIDAIKADNRVSFTVFDKGVAVDGKIGPNVRSVIVFGRVTPLETTPETLQIARRLGEKYNPAGYVADELKRTAERIQVLELAVDHMTGKRVNES